MGNKVFSSRLVLPFLLALMLSAAGCEKEEYGEMLSEADGVIAALTWSESGSQILYVTWDEQDYYKRHIWLADIASGNVNMITSVTADLEPDRIINEKDGRIYYFNTTYNEYWSLKLFAIDFSGSNREMILDSLQNPVFSQKYVAYIKYYYLPDTSYSEIQLYDLDNKTTKKAEIGRDGYPVSISPDGSTLLIQSFDIQYNRTVFILYDTGSDTGTELTVSSTLYFSKYFWIDNSVYGWSGYGEYSKIINLASGRELAFSEPLTSVYPYALSPSGSILAYMFAEPPALAQGLVGSHIYLYILRAGSAEKTVIDLDRGDIYPGIIAFSPDETRIAYVRDGNEIYILDL